jgi:hypothetical protein
VKKKEGQKHHAIQRANERYQLKLNGRDLGAIAQIIKSGNSTFLKAHSIRVRIHLVKYMNTELVVGYDTQAHSVCTILPKNAWERGKRE